MERWQNKLAVVTDASTTIGAAIIKDLINAGVRVVGLAKHEELIGEFIKTLPQDDRPLFTVINCDITELQSVNLTFDKIISEFGGIDILAGSLVESLSVSTDSHIACEILQTNIYCTQRAFKSMEDHNIDACGLKGYAGSLADLADANIYSASKFAINALTEVYQNEFLAVDTKTKITDRIINPCDVSNAVLSVLSTPPDVYIQEVVIKPIDDVV